MYNLDQMDKQSLASSAGKIDEVLTRGVAEVLPSREALAKLMRERSITLYQGFDPSAPSLHLGNLVGVMKLRQFQQLGHKVYFLIGDFSGMIGDPTDKLATRKQLTREEVNENFKEWKNQIKNLLDFEGENPVKIVLNGSWLDKLSFKELLNITSNFTYQQMIERDMFQKRIAESKPIYLHELLYPVATAIDSVELDVDLEVGGNDQMFNLLVGRTLMKAVKNKEKFCLTTKLIVDKEGSKVGKTTGNALFLSSGPEQFYGGIMSFPDETIELGFELLTETELEGLGEIIKTNPMSEKKRLAFEIVKLVWGEEEAKKAQNTFEKNFQQAEPEYDREVQVKDDLINTIAQIGKSKSEVKRLLAQKAVDINGNTVTDPSTQVQVGDKIKVGERTFLKVV
jgi:tyrosyl-tRNA synthetase